MIDKAFLAEVARLAGTQRDMTFKMAVEIANALRVKSIVETGCYRGIHWDGQSTRIFALLAKEIGATVDSVDIDQGHINKASKLVEDIGNVSFHCGDSVRWLSLRVDPVDFLYLDSYDYDEHVPSNSQIHQIAELGAAFGKLSKSCVIMLDDCNIKGGGKGKLSSVFLLERGFKMEFDGHQRIFVR